MKTNKTLDTLLSVLVLSVSLFSCQKIGPEGGVSGRPITPRLSSVPMPTRGSAVTTSGLNVDGRQFMMNAWLGSANRYDGTDDGGVYVAADKDNYRFIKDVTVTCGGGNWSLSSEHDWRNSVPTSFWTVYPKSVSGWDIIWPGDQASDEDQSKLSFTYTIPAAADTPGAGAERQPDLCVAFSQKTWTDGEDNFVDIDFKHALAAVHFDITGVPEDIKVTKIAVKGIKGSGTCSVIGHTDGDGSSKDVTFNWTVEGSDRNWSQSYSDSDFVTAGTHRVVNPSGQKIFMLIPQSLNAFAKLAVTFDDGGGTPVTKEAGISGSKLKAGREYTYNLKFKEGTLTAELVEEYNGSRLGGDDLGGDNETYNGGRTGGDDLNGGNEDYNGGSLGGGTLDDNGLESYNGDLLGEPDYVVIDNLKWTRQNISVSASGSKIWKGNNGTAVKVPGTDEDVVNGDFFQWGAHEGYAGNAADSDRGLLLYTSFTSEACGDATHSFSFKSGKQFNKANAPYGGSSYSKYKSSTSSLELSDDVAHIVLGGSWRMPTKDDMVNMKAATYWEWDSVDRGFYVYAPNPITDKGKVNNGTGTYDRSTALLFFPANGYGYETELNNPGEYGFCWYGNISAGSTEYGCYMSFNSGTVATETNNSRFHGFTVRAVSDL